MDDDIVQQSGELVRAIRAEVRAELEKSQQERIDTRTLPPMAKMTRMQRRYFLEPWMTVLTVASWVVAFAGYILAMWTARHVEWSMFGLLFTLAGAATLITKLNFMEWNSKTESQIADRNSRSDYDY